MINQEEIFTAIQKENWELLIATLHKNKKEINSDPLLKLAAQTFISEFLSKVDSSQLENVPTILNLEMLWVLDKGKFYVLSEADRKKLVCQIVKRKQNKIIEAYNYAKIYPDEEICKKIIDEYEKLMPRTVEHSQSHIISVTERRDIAKVDYTINLFKSAQEIEFFYALKKTFDSYQIYPNVAISCLLNWQLLKDELTSEEKELYFKGIVDFVIFDQAEGFKPIYFFELDSIYHDLQGRKEKDNLKDSIFAKAGAKILRIRKMSKYQDEKAFIKLIRDLLKQ